MRANLQTDLGLKPDQIEHVRHGMWRVVNDPGGTAPHAKLKDAELAGKTGTAEFWRNGVKDNHTWFICFAPYQKPKYAIVRVHPGSQGRRRHGGSARVARIMERSPRVETTGKYWRWMSSRWSPAKGSFAFINNIDYVTSNAARGADGRERPGCREKEISSIKAITTKKELLTSLHAVEEDDDETAPAHRQQIRATTTPITTAWPPPSPRCARRPTTTEPSAKTASGSNGATTDTPLMKSMRKFFRRDNNGDSGSDDTEAQTKTLRKQHKAQQQKAQQLSASQPPAQPTPPPKRKKFLGLF